MKRFMILLLLGLFLLVGRGDLLKPADAHITRLDSNKLETYVIVNDSAADFLHTAVSTATIIPGRHRILGYELCPIGTTTTAANIAPIIVLYDAATVAAIADTNLFGETEGPLTESVVRWLSYPKGLDDGLVVVQGTSTTAIIYYERFVR